MLTIAQQELDFEYWEARKAFGQERILASKYLADWFNSYDRDWVFSPDKRYWLCECGRKEKVTTSREFRPKMGYGEI